MPCGVCVLGQNVENQQTNPMWLPFSPSERHAAKIQVSFLWKAWVSESASVSTYQSIPFFKTREVGFYTSAPHDKFSCDPQRTTLVRVYTKGLCRTTFGRPAKQMLSALGHVVTTHGLSSLQTLTDSMPIQLGSVPTTSRTGGLIWIVLMHPGIITKAEPPRKECDKLTEHHGLTLPAGGKMGP